MDSDQIPSNREVVSIPAGNTLPLVNRHGIYSCPVSYPVRESLYATFRETGSTMDRLFLIQDHLELPCSVEAIQNDTNLPDTERTRILAYLKDPDAAKTIKELNPENPAFGTPVRFYILDRERVVWLPYAAKMENPNVATVYYTLRELLDPATAPSARPASREEA